MRGGCQWSPEKDITLWHGKGGILDEVNLSGRSVIFLRILRAIQGSIGDLEIDLIDDMWPLLTSTTAQLSEALVKLIKENNNEKEN